MLLICFNRAIVSELKEEVRCSARDRGSVSRQTTSSSFHGIAEHLNHTCTLDLGASLLPQCHGGEVRVKEAASDSEDSSLTPSLAEVSSDDLSWLDDRDPGEGDRSLLSAHKHHASHNLSNHLRTCQHKVLNRGDNEQNTIWAPTQAFQQDWTCICLCCPSPTHLAQPSLIDMLEHGERSSVFVTSGYSQLNI